MSFIDDLYELSLSWAQLNRRPATRIILGRLQQEAVLREVMRDQASLFGAGLADRNTLRSNVVAIYGMTLERADALTRIDFA